MDVEGLQMAAREAERTEGEEETDRWDRDGDRLSWWGDNVANITL